SRLAIALAQAGGMGIIHKSMSVDQQATQVRQVKKFESGIIANPITVGPNATIREVLELTRAEGISGVPVVDGRQPIGIVTSRDLRFELQYDAPVTQAMTPRERLITVPQGASRGEVRKLLHEHRIEKV